MPTATPEQIRETESKPRVIQVYPWMAVYMSRSWQEMKKNILEDLKHKRTTSASCLATASGLPTASGTGAPPRNGQ